MKRLARTTLPWLAVTAIVASWTACSAPGTGPDADSPLSAARHAAMPGLAGSADEAESARLLIEQLDHDDPAVRWRAGSILERRTGQTLGFRYDDPPETRRAAVRRWARWHESVHGRSESPASPERKVSDG